MAQPTVNELAANGATGLLDFFGAVSIGLGNTDSIKASCDSIAITLMQQHALITVGDLKARVPARPVMTEILVRAQAPLTYLDALEHWLGIKFLLLASTAAATTPTEPVPSAGQGYRGARFMAKNAQTLGELLHSVQRLDELALPPGLFAGVPEKGRAVLAYKHISTISERVLIWTIFAYGMCDVDKIFRTTVGLQLESMYPNLATVKGKPRQWSEVLKNKFQNARKSVRTVRTPAASASGFAPQRARQLRAPAATMAPH